MPVVPNRPLSRGELFNKANTQRVYTFSPKEQAIKRTRSVAVKIKRGK